MDRMWVNGRSVRADSPEAAPFMEKEYERIRQAKEAAKEWGMEYITEDAAAALFGITNAAVRQARRKGLVAFTTTHAVSNGPPIHLLILSSAMKYWAKGGANYDAALDEMRGNGLTLGKGGTVYNILHVRPLLRLARSLAGKPLAGFRATPSRRIPVLYGMVVYAIRFNNQLLHRQPTLRKRRLGENWGFRPSF